MQANPYIKFLFFYLFLHFCKDCIVIFYKRTCVDEANMSEAYVLKPNEEVLLCGVIHMQKHFSCPLYIKYGKRNQMTL